MYELKIKTDVIKFLKKLDSGTSERIFKKILTLKENPYSKDCKRIVNTRDKVFRVRLGDFRILYRIENHKIVIVFLVDKRGRVYER
jgi:mRNA interferase RelE/StbE